MTNKFLLWWQSLSGFGQQLVIAISATVIAGLVIWMLLFPVRHFVTRHLEDKRKQDKKLKIHFEELKREAQEIIRIISRVTENYGKIVSHSQAIYSELTSVVLPQPSDSFMAHFPEETTELAEYERKIKAHNGDYEGFRLKIMNVFTSQGIFVASSNCQITPCIYESIFEPLFNYWKGVSADRPPFPDFSKIEQTYISGDYIELYPKGWRASVAAHVQAESDKTEYSHALRKVAENREFRREAATLATSATQLDEQITTFRMQLLDKLGDVDRLWPGTRKYTFRKEKNCPRCKEIFL
jgi:hypothetical protein